MKSNRYSAFLFNAKGKMIWEAVYICFSMKEARILAQADLIKAGKAYLDVKIYKEE